MTVIPSCCLLHFGDFLGRGPMCVEGEFIWKLKDKVDRDWLGGYQNLVPMSMQPPHDPDDLTTQPEGVDSTLINKLSPEVRNVLSQQSMRLFFRFLDYATITYVFLTLIGVVGVGQRLELTFFSVL